MPFLKELGDLIGIYTLLVGLYANFYILSQLAAGESIAINPVSKASSWKTFYDQIFSVFSANVQSSKPHIAGVVAFLKQYDIALNHDITFEAKLRLPKPPPFELRQNAADEMQRVAVLHLEGKTGGGGFLFKQTYPYLRHVFAAAQVQLLGKINPKTKKIVFSMLKFVEGESEDATTRDNFCRELGDADAGLVADIAVDVVRAERSALATYL